MLEILGQILSFIWEMLPRPVLVGPTERASCWLLGRWGRDCGPGLYIVWPLVMHWNVYPVVSQVCETTMLAVCDRDGQSWNYRLAVEYEIQNVLEFDTASFDGQLHIEQVAAACFVSMISGQSTRFLHETSLPRLARNVKDRASASLAGRGAVILHVRIVTATRSVPLFLSQAERLAVR